MKALVSEKLQDYLFVVASNREPYIHNYFANEIKCVVPASGLTMALDPVLRTCGGVWVAHGGGEADRKVVDEKNRILVPPENPKYTLRRLWLNKAEETGYYYGFSNETLWPLCHIVYVKPKFDEADWLHYKAVNEKFAKTILDEVGDKKAFVFIQDYHLTLVPKLLREINPEIKTALFWHIPWPNPEAFRICPWKDEILRGMLGADLLGFHIPYHVDNFLNTVDQTLEVRVDKVSSTIISSGRETLVKPFQISVDYEKMSSDANLPELQSEIERLKKEYGLENRLIGVGSDRLDYTKGIPERFNAIDKFFEKYPEFIGKFTFIQAGVLSRIHIQRYKDLNDEINAQVERINWKYCNDSCNGNWSPIILVRRQFSQKELVAIYVMADICIVSSLHDGMNLVAKEYIATADPKKGMLILSRFTGAARELTDALLVNPYAPDAFADSIKTGLEMPQDEKEKRMLKMKSIVSENNIYRWAGKIIQSLLRLA
ncbi:trehalose-6-phosphate synthase [candidate division WOR-1 bacterium RIFOXYD2_FULL_36_8]|uniref:Trehalose-6-phosphate synthase n=1 Tax=candidate division WOR-1 bacterium RIFOXYB2_FULL_36_35 TaxID=1802578 RepID=A0A1F4S4Z0_UNCSA|nr:MAG: trehalose-6-phosphate synthase [candidate division WOR-1 bacterium RIFOXYA2_FULL_36_21]OGC14803.1 MAG: trehalose-6-phosphate synthase [candidate division WOR-1 bacterium RIFOXYB2_FULL_36_35]OGC16574.1 MAG: trehalose-6-phosphate synthase [candidate division WOR-1 bacterium RIFOXYA12_FULL_36_13]OGC37735.1 MAG: trehalose-6-phosphate synthase [candidate division WOR-1 bacterium RIFOXYD2_FULL_36_8]